MLKASISLCTLVLTLSMTACKEQAPAPDTQQADSQAIRDNEAAWVKDWQAKDVDKITSHFAPDASLLVPDMPAMKGADDIKVGVGPGLKDPHFSLTFGPTLVVVSKGADLAYTQGTYTMTFTEPKTGNILIEKGKYVTVYQKQSDRSWKATEDIFNPDAPAAPGQT